MTRPLAGSSRFTAAAVVDFPEPDSPTSATVDPVGTVRERSRTAAWSPPVVPKTTVRFSMARMGPSARHVVPSHDFVRRISFAPNRSSTRSAPSGVQPWRA